MNDNERRLYKALLALNDEEECRRFLADICTVKEVEDGRLVKATFHIETPKLATRKPEEEEVISE